MESKQSESKKSMLSVRIDTDLKHELKVRAAQERRTSSSVIEDGVRRYLSESAGE